MRSDRAAARRSQHASGASRGAAVALLLVLAHGCGRAAAIEATPPASITPDVRIQAAIASVAQARSEQEFAARTRELAAFGGPNYSNLVPQLVVYALQQDDTRAAMIPGAIRERLRITDTQLVEALLPYLDTPDRQQRAQIENWLAGIDRKGEKRDYTVYHAVIVAHHADPPLGLVRYMYAAEPDAALTALADVYAAPDERSALAGARGPIVRAIDAQRAGRLDADKIAAARKALPALCASDAWWVRLYAATVLVQVPPLRTPKLVDTLRGDTNPLVRETIKSAG
jgi:hypothetical protein